jgi:hypothetical protein
MKRVVVGLLAVLIGACDGATEPKGPPFRVSIDSLLFDAEQCRTTTCEIRMYGDVRNGRDIPLSNVRMWSVTSQGFYGPETRTSSTGQYELTYSYTKTELNRHFNVCAGLDEGYLEHNPESCATLEIRAPGQHVFVKAYNQDEWPTPVAYIHPGTSPPLADQQFVFWALSSQQHLQPCVDTGMCRITITGEIRDAGNRRVAGGAITSFNIADNGTATAGPTAASGADGTFSFEWYVPYRPGVLFTLAVCAAQPVMTEPNAKCMRPQFRAPA